MIYLPIEAIDEATAQLEEPRGAATPKKTGAADTPVPGATALAWERAR